MSAQSPKPETKKAIKKEENPIVEIVKTVVMAGILSFGIRTFVAEARYIPSSSMEPTLQINDRLIIEKMTFRFRPPERGEIIVFEATEAIQELGWNGAFIKRVIGLPGDEVIVRNGDVTVNGQVLKEPYIQDAPKYDWGPVIVPENSYLVLGDNRNNSSDSHIWGFVPHENIIGRATVRFWPFNRLGGIDENSALADTLIESAQ
ncbi:MAG: signal peptidase I [Cyanobacterium sp.]